MSTIHAVLLGLLQGLTEFLPVSSSGHLAVGQMLLGLRKGNLALSVLLHGGTLLATLLFFRARLQHMLRDGWSTLRGRSAPTETNGAHDVVTVLIATVPTAIVGLTFEEVVSRWTTNPTAVALGFLVTALLLISSHFAPKGDVQFASAKVALFVGCAQALAIVPGISRSGATIAALLWCGLDARRAFELSMLISLPPIGGALLLEARHLDGSVPIGTGLLGAAIACGSGWVALSWLSGLVRRGRFPWFALWVVPLAAMTAFLGK